MYCVLEYFLFNPDGQTVIKLVRYTLAAWKLKAFEGYQSIDILRPPVIFMMSESAEKTIPRS